MIVQNLGYHNLDQVIDLEDFSIYETNMGTEILVAGCHDKSITLYQPKTDRLPYKITEGKRICDAVKIFDSKSGLAYINTTCWNNGNQIMAYTQFQSGMVPPLKNYKTKKKASFIR